MFKEGSFFRVLKALAIIKAKPGVKSRELARILEVSPRTIFRTVESLRQLGINISGDQNGYKIKGDTLLPSLNFTLEEALAMVFASRGSFPLEGILGEELEGALVKLKNSLPSSLLARVNEMERSTAIFRGPYTPLSQEHRLIFKTLEDGARSKRSVDVLYQAIGEDKPLKRRIDPYRVFFRHHSWYVVAYSHEDKGVRLYRLNRFSRANLTPFSFCVQDGFNLDSFLESAFQVIGGTDLKEVVVKFEPSIAPLIQEVVWHPTQELKKTRDGYLLFSVRVAEPREVLRWAFSWGEKAEILSPPELRGEAKRIAGELLRKY
ncbi:MAG: WYL domain-containing protein [Caldiserica bacterium]|nr:WYL domain-containing protein [Caldisericota bacterium]MDH7562029.1 WYL domain-containing protein [Caldisericota bacterium]